MMKYKFSCVFRLLLLIFYSGVLAAQPDSASSNARTLLFWKNKHKNDPISITLDVLDAMSRLFPFQHKFPRRLFKKIWNCLEQVSTDDMPMRNVSDAAWEGFLQYGRSDGTANDVWGTDGIYIEDNPTPLDTNNDFIPGATGIEITEPCNTISNVAYYRSMVELCGTEERLLQKWSFPDEVVRSIIQSFSILAFGSSFWHGSQTSIGQLIDNLSISLIAYNIHQATIGTLSFQTQLYYLQDSNRSYTAIAATDKTLEVLLEESVYDWNATLSEIDGDIPYYTTTFSALAIIVLLISLPQRIAERISGFLADVLLRTDEEREFAINTLQPLVMESFKSNGIKAGILDRVFVFCSFVGMITKMLYAFTWQEQIIPVPSFLLSSSLLNIIGAKLIPFVNMFGNRFTRFGRWGDIAFQLSLKVYPGSFYCSNLATPHSKWHEQSANAFVDLVYLLNDVQRILSGGKLFLSSKDVAEPMKCFLENACMDDFELTADYDPILATFQECTMILLDAQPSDDAGALGNCLATSLQEHSNENANYMDGLDSCLVRNGCVRFSALADLDVTKIWECIDSGSVCESYIQADQSTAVNSCLIDCDTNMFCVGACLFKHADLSPATERIAACVQTLSKITKDSIEDDSFLLESCLSTSGQINEFDASSGITERFAKGLSRMTECAATQCRQTYQAWNDERLSTQTCMEECSEGTDTLNEPIKSLPMSRSFLCAIKCSVGLR